MTTNLHTHTFRCRHAICYEPEYIEKAISGGLSRLGFSDHAPYCFMKGYYSNYRMFPEQMDDYVDTLEKLADEYKDKIDIKIGYELEYYSLFWEDTLQMIRRRRCDYIILGQHFIDSEITGRYVGVGGGEDFLRQYVDESIEAMRTGLYTYMAHPDIVSYRGSDVAYAREFARLIKVAKEENVPLEINLLGIREDRWYPRYRFWELVSEIGAPVCIGSDAHEPSVVADTSSAEVAKQWIDRLGLKFVESPELRKIK